MHTKEKSRLNSTCWWSSAPPPSTPPWRRPGSASLQHRVNQLGLLGWMPSRCWCKERPLSPSDFPSFLQPGSHGLNNKHCPSLAQATWTGEIFDTVWLCCSELKTNQQKLLNKMRLSFCFIAPTIIICLKTGIDTFRKQKHLCTLQ